MKYIRYGIAILIVLVATSTASDLAYTNELYATIHYLYPDISDNDFVVSDNGNGQYISYWNSAHPLPTDIELTTAYSGLQAQRIKDYQNYVTISRNNSLIINDTATTYGVNTQDIDTAQSVEIMQLKNKVQTLETTLNRICTNQPTLC